MLPPWKKSYNKHRQSTKKQRRHFANKGLLVKAMVFSSSHIWIWELDYKESWALKNWCFQTVVLDESTLDSKEIKPVNPKGNQPWKFIGRTGAESSSTLATWCKELTHCKDLDAGKGWRQEEKGTTEDEMVGWHHRLNGHEFEQTLGDSEGQGSLACCSLWGCKELDMMSS